MAVPVVASSATTVSADGLGPDIVITKPSGTALNDVLYAIVMNDFSGHTYSTPSGWTYETDINDGTCRMYMFSKRAGGSEPANYTFSSSNNGWHNGGILRVTGVDSSIVDLTHTIATFDDNTTGTGHSSPSITTTEPDCLILSAFAVDNVAVDSFSPAGSETEVFDIQNPTFNMMVLACFSTNQAGAGSISHNVTMAPAGEACGSITWAIQANVLTPPSAHVTVR